MTEDSDPIAKPAKKKKQYKANQGVTHDEEKQKLNAALDRLGLARGGHRGMHHGRRVKES